MYQVYQYDETGKPIYRHACDSADMAVELCQELEATWGDGDTAYGACFIMHEGSVVGDSDGLCGPANEDMEHHAQYACDCGYHN